MNKEELTNVVSELINLGEDSDELNYWLGIYDFLPEDKKALLYANLKQEVETLK